MAGDWIKMRLSLQTHPKVVRILSATKSDKFRAIGGLHAVWAVFDTHSVDGRLDGYTAETLDHIIGWNGFSAALIGVGWLVEDGTDALVLPDFDEHNGASGKRRAEDQKRKRDTRKNPQPVRNESGQNADKKRTREEKRREENKELKPTPQTPAPTGAVVPADPAPPDPLKPDRRKEHRASEDVKQVFTYWQQAMSHQQAKLDDKRSKAIGKRLADGYTVDDLCRAVDGCKLTPHNMGENDTGSVYDDIELICRDGAHVDRFLKTVQRGGRPLKGDNFHVAGIDHSSSRAAMDASMKHHGIKVPEGDDPIEFN
jgi:hypothetical protein